jgi:hypothetical protein
VEETLDYSLFLHAPIETLAHDAGGATLSDGSVLHPETARRLSCDSTTRVVAEDEGGTPVGIGRKSQTVFTAREACRDLRGGRGLLTAVRPDPSA